MISFLHSLFALLSQFISLFKNHQIDRQKQLESNQADKADAYDKLQKAIKARDIVRNSITSDSPMSDDGYQRKQ